MLFHNLANELSKTDDSPCPKMPEDARSGGDRLNWQNKPNG
jgi:hypothetical protein